jgi:hypothetical protein
VKILEDTRDRLRDKAEVILRKQEQFKVPELAKPKFQALITVAVSGTPNMYDYWHNSTNRDK